MSGATAQKILLHTKIPLIGKFPGNFSGVSRKLSVFETYWTVSHFFLKTVFPGNFFQFSRKLFFCFQETFRPAFSCLCKRILLIVWGTQVSDEISKTWNKHYRNAKCSFWLKPETDTQGSHGLVWPNEQKCYITGTTAPPPT